MKIILIVLVSMVLASCSTTPSSDLTSEIEANEAAIEAVKAIDSYYLVPCKKPSKMEQDDLSYILDYIDKLVLDYSECFKRHNGLIPQVK